MADWEQRYWDEQKEHEKKINRLTGIAVISTISLIFMIVMYIMTCQSENDKWREYNGYMVPKIHSSDYAKILHDYAVDSQDYAGDAQYDFCADYLTDNDWSVYYTSFF